MKYKTTIDLTNKANSQTLIYDLAQKFSAGSSLNILDVGCSSGYLGEALTYAGHTVWGVEQDHTAAEVAKTLLNHLFEGSIEDFFQQYPEQRFNVIIFGDVLEHLIDPLSILKLCKSHLAEHGAIIASIPNVAHLSIRAMLLEGRWEYTELGILDRTHVKFFTRQTLIQLFSDAAYKVSELYPVRISVNQANSMCGLTLDSNILHEAENLLKNDDTKLDFQYVLLAEPVSDENQATKLNLPMSNKIGIRIVCILITDLSSPLVELRLRLPLERWAFEYGGYVRFVGIFEYTKDDIEWGDIFVFHREAGGKYGLELIEFLKSYNKKIIFEIDDLLTDLPKFLINYAHSVKNKKYLVKSLALADAITVTTPRLAKELSVYNPNVYCVPNCSEALPDNIAKHYAVPQNEITLIVASSDNVLIDFIIQALKQAQQQFSIQIIAIGPLAELFSNAGLIVKKTERMTYQGFKTFVSSIDNVIGLIPLDDSLFSSCKSPIKYFDYSVAGVPSICSNVPPYSDHIVHGENGFLVENTFESWFNAIETLVTNHTMRATVAQAATKYVQDGYNWQTAAHAWQSVLAPLTDEVLAERTKNRTIKMTPLARKRIFRHAISLLTLPLAYKRAFEVLTKDGIGEVLRRTKRLFIKQL